MSSHLKQHLRLHSPDPALQCPTCKRHFTSKSKLRIHQLREAGLKSHRCHLCSYSAVERNSLRRHLVSVHADRAEDSPELNFACPVCKERFGQSKLLKIHMKSHNVVKNSAQHFCIEEGCSFKSSLLHLIQHITEKHAFAPIECQHHACTAIFRTKTLMEEHFKSHQAYHCPDCDFACSNKRLFAQHCRQGHAGGEQFSCEFCDFKTFNSVEFERHVGHFHAAEKIHKCSECEFSTAHKRGLKRHMLIHTGEKGHKCSVCEFRCRDRSYLSRHMLRHGHSKNHMCSECGYVTKWKHYLTVHMRKHNGDLRYGCDQCSYRSHRMDQLNSHKLRHQQKSLICEICAYSCKRKYELSQHMISKHAKNDQPAAVYKCKFCSYASSYRQALKNHENCKHTKSKQFQCALCGYTSFSGTSLFLHKRKTHGYVPGDKAWLQNYALKEKEKNMTGNFDVFYNNTTSKRHISAVDASETNAKIDVASDLNVISQEVAHNDNFESPGEEYCTLVLTTLPSTDEQTSTLRENSQNSTDAAENDNKNARLATSFSSEEEEGDASLDGEQNYLVKPNQIEEFEEIEKSHCSKLQNENTVKDLKELEKIQANALVLDGHVELLMLPTQKSSKINLLRNRQKLNCHDCGAEFKLRRNLDNHCKNKCISNRNRERKMAASDASLQISKLIDGEVGEVPSNTETKNLGCNFNLQTGNEPQSNIYANSDGFSKTIQNGASLCSQAKTTNILTVDNDCLYAKVNGKFECKECGFSAIRLATIERHIANCVTKPSTQKSLKIVGKNRLEDLEEISENTASIRSFNCSVCEFVAKSMQSLNRHIVLVHKKVACNLKRRFLQHVAVKHDAKSPFQCRFCTFTTKRKYRLEEHESIHTRVGRRTCEICDKTFGSLSKLQKHKSRLHDKNPTHFCTICDFSSFSRDDIKRHDTRCHSGDMKFTCQKCDAKFSSQISLSKHCKRVHTGSFTCKQCEYTCGSVVELKTHHVSAHKLAKETVLKEITTAKHSKANHTCPLCQFTAQTKKTLVQHLSEEHENTPDDAKLLKCGQCEFTCKFQVVLEHHLRRHGGKRLYRCTHCEYSSRNKQKITWHIRTHTGDRPYRCEVCGYTCTEPSRLKQHMRVHQEERKYLCPECGYKCKWATQLKCHMTKHTGEKRFACADCDYRSNRADALRSHRHTQHNSDRPFICEKCGKSFKTNFILKSHQQQHSDARPFTCGLCQKSFKWPAGLRHHFLSHTKQTPFCCRVCSYRAKQRFQVVRHLKKHHPGVTVEEGVERDGEIGGLTIKEALEGAAEQK
uniref:C2H2-type domain-containing protein n=1 Tax=Periophthalmus magnuspinnatus TaxID=409849 RepID=A0A3B3ZPE6_9GOBI